MNSLWKEMAVRAPVVTAAALTVVLIFSKILDHDLPPWMYFATATFTLIFTSLIIYLHFNRKKSTTLLIKAQNFEKISTDGGEFSIGVNGGNIESVEIDNVKAKDIKTGGGDFIVGIKDKS